VRDEFSSVTYVVRNMANDAFDQKFENHNNKMLSYRRETALQGAL